MTSSREREDVIETSPRRRGIAIIALGLGICAIGYPVGSEALIAVGLITSSVGVAVEVADELSFKRMQSEDSVN